MRRLGRVLRLLALLALAPAAAGAQPLVADLSSHLIAVTTGFAGTDLLLFGATEEQGDVIVVVRGPDRPEVVRRKARIAGIWVNTDEVNFATVPSFYNVAASRPLVELEAERTLARHQIGVDNLRLGGAEEVPEQLRQVFREALVRNKQRQGLFPAAETRIAFLGGRLFRTDVSFPSNVPTGSYSVTVFLLRQGELISAQTTPLVVSKIGVGARIFEFAHRYAAAYGLLAILVALGAGWLAGAIFRKA